MSADLIPMEYPLPAQIACVEREIAMRLRVYPKWVGTGRMTDAKASQEIACMRAVLETLKHAHDARQRPDPLSQALNEGGGVYRP